MDHKLALYVIISILSFIVLERALNSLLTYFTSSPSLYLYCENIVSEIGPREYFYQTHYSREQLEVRVTPITEDPDLYISYKAFPFSDILKHDQDSCTCGTEVIITNQDIRPVYTGVYCYSLYTNCTFQLSVCALKNQTDIADNQLSYHESTKKRLKSSFLMFMEAFFTEILPALF